MSTRICSLAIFVASLTFCTNTATADGPLRKRLFGDDGPPTAGRSSTGEARIPGARLAQGAKKLITGAGERIMFWRDDQPRESSEFVEGTGRFFRPDLSEKEDRRKPFSLVRPASWFEEEPPADTGPQSVHDWIGQPRPGFE